jgi:hypothetical protein
VPDRATERPSVHPFGYDGGHAQAGDLDPPDDLAIAGPVGGSFSALTPGAGHDDGLPELVDAPVFLGLIAPGIHTDESAVTQADQGDQKQPALDASQTFSWQGHHSRKRPVTRRARGRRMHRDDADFRWLQHFWRRE